MCDDIDTSNAGHAEVGPPPPPPPPPPLASRRPLLGRRTATAALAGGLVVGGITGGYLITQAATATPSPSASPSAALPGDPGDAGPHHGGFGGRGSAHVTQDLQQAAGVIGVTEAQLQTELTAGKTIAAVAKEHNVDVAKVISTLVGDENSEIDASVSSGRLTQAQAAQMKGQTQQRVSNLVNRTGPAHGPAGFGGRRGGAQAEDQQVVAAALGITAAQLQTETSAGKTIAAIAKEHNVDAAKVISALVASENTEIDQRVSSGQITAAQGAQMKTATTQRVTDEVNGTEPAGEQGKGDGGGGTSPAASPGSSSTQ
ncbi:MAG: hypothetical protein JF887_03410 [Candidatus Dormibacteraeota bacterium]|uniref:Uncharacterized protein n=1 Tax=Candidatus Amunia macphersoniae TaxID=3127014 RepID=A0A934NFS2_9BACT|nr:hypothetical protein [Candidatus Dormibacteraeota bacterium]